MKTHAARAAATAPLQRAGNLSMNTHIHILEPMTCYFRIRHDACVEESLVNLIEITARRIYDTEHHHFVMFFNDKMEPLPAKFRSAMTLRAPGC